MILALIVLSTLDSGEIPDLCPTVCHGRRVWENQKLGLKLEGSAWNPEAAKWLNQTGRGEGELAGWLVGLFLISQVNLFSKKWVVYLHCILVPSVLWFHLSKNIFLFINLLIDRHFQLFAIGVLCLLQSRFFPNVTNS